MKNPLAAAGAVKDALSTGGVDKVREKIKIETSLGTQVCLETSLGTQVCLETKLSPIKANAV